MKLKEVLEIKPGTLIKGLKISLAGTVHFSTEGWMMAQRRLVRNFLTCTDRNNFSYTFYKNIKVQEHINNKVITINNDENFSYATLKKNGRAVVTDMLIHFSQENIVNGECIGMSLGENFIALQPSNYGMYRPDYYYVYILHKILHAQEIKWVILQSKQIRKSVMINNTQDILDFQTELM